MQFLLVGIINFHWLESNQIKWNFYGQRLIFIFIFTLLERDRYMSMFEDELQINDQNFCFQTWMHMQYCINIVSWWLHLFHVNSNFKIGRIHWEVKWRVCPKICGSGKFLRQSGSSSDNIEDISNTENSYVGDSPAPIVKSVKFTCAHVNFTLNIISMIVLDRRNSSRGF